MPPRLVFSSFRPCLRKGKEEDFRNEKTKSLYPSRYACLLLLTAYFEPQQGVSRASVAQTSFTQTVKDATLDWFRPRHIALFGLDVKRLKQEEYVQKELGRLCVARWCASFSTRYTPKSHRCFLTPYRMDRDLPEVDILSHVYTVL